MGLNLNILGAVAAGYLITLLTAGLKDAMVGIVLGVAAMDVFSFTRAGTNTLNAKLTNRTNTLARLSICLPVPEMLGLQPIIGVGDLIYYSFMTLFSLNSEGVYAGLIVLSIILTGQLANILFISILKSKHRINGFPATLFPGIFFIIGTFWGIV